MSAQPEPRPSRHDHLRVVTINEAGETREGCPHCAAYEVELEGQSSTIRSLSAKLEQAKRDREKAAREDALWPDASRLFLLYCRLTANPGKPPRKLTWGADRFEEVRPFLKKHGLAMCERAIIGRVFDHHTGQRKNGSTIHYHEWGRIFGNLGKGSASENFEESCNRAPTDFVSSLVAEDEAKAEAERQAVQARSDEREGKAAL